LLLLDDSIALGPMTFYRDHASPSTFHYMPGKVQVVTENGMARAQLLRYRGVSPDGAMQGGGILSLDVQLARDQAALQDAQKQLATRFAVEPNLVPVLFDNGTARLSLLDFHPADAAANTNSMFVEKVLGTTVPSLLGQQRAIFSARLTPEGSTLIEKALRDGSAPVLIVYDLEFSGLMPARGMRAKVHYQMSYDYLRTRFQANTLYFKADLDREAESLAKSGSIEIEDVDFQGLSPEVRARRTEELRATLSQLMQGLFFRPAASPAAANVFSGNTPSGADAYWASQGRPQIAFVMRGLEQHEDDLLTYDLTESQVTKQRVAPQGALQLPKDADASKLILDVTADWPSPITQVHAFTLPDANWAGVSAVEVSLRHGDDQRTLVLSPTQREVTANFSESPIEYRAHALIQPDPEALGDPPTADGTFRELTTDNLFVDPAVLGGQRALRVALGAIDFSTINKVAGQLQMKDSRRDFQLDKSRRELVVNVWGSEAIQLSAALFFTDGNSISVQRVVNPADKVVLINQPANQFHVVELIFHDPLERFDSVHVAIEAAAGASRRSVMLDAGTPMAHWSAPRAADSPRTFRYQLRKVLRNSSVIEEDWKEASGSLLVVGDPEIRIETIQGIVVGGQNAQGGLVRLAPAPPPPGIDGTQEIMLDAGQVEFTARLPFDGLTPRKYTVSGQLFFDFGVVDLPSHEDTSEVLLITAHA
jgi:hypothetical protein